MDRKGKKEARTSGTTVLAFRYEDGIICAGDRLLDLNDGFIARDYQKIHRVTDDSLFLAAGTLSLIQEIHDLFTQKCQEADDAMSVREQAIELARLCRDTEMEEEDDEFDAILAGVNADGTHEMFRVDDNGVVVPFWRFSACGSGGEAALATLHLYWGQAWLDGLDLSRGLSLAVRAMGIAALHDTKSSDPRLTPPSVAVISDGARYVADDEVFRVCERIARGDSQLADELAADIRLRPSRVP